MGPLHGSGATVKSGEPDAGAARGSASPATFQRHMDVAIGLWRVGCRFV